MRGRGMGDRSPPSPGAEPQPRSLRSIPRSPFRFWFAGQSERVDGGIEDARSGGASTAPAGTGQFSSCRRLGMAADDGSPAAQLVGASGDGPYLSDARPVGPAVT